MVLERGNRDGHTYEQVPHLMQSFAQSFSTFAKSPLTIAWYSIAGCSLIGHAEIHLEQCIQAVVF